MQRIQLGNWVKGLGILLLAALFSGCFSPSPREDTTTQPAPPPDVNPDVLHVGDTVHIDFSGVAVQIPPHEEQIKDDGTITLDLLGRVPAAGKTPRQLEEDIVRRAVPKWYVRLTVTVRAPERYYYVGGEVRMPNRQLYVGAVTVLKAIQAAGDFTDFANKRKVRLQRSNGQTYIIDCIKARKNPKLDLPVYPGDRIDVERAFL